MTRSKFLHTITYETEPSLLDNVTTQTRIYCEVCHAGGLVYRNERIEEFKKEICLQAIENEFSRLQTWCEGLEDKLSRLIEP